MQILGLTTLGDAAATLIRDGGPVAAVEEERFSRRRHHCGFPYQAIEYCLAAGGISIGDLDHVCLYWKPWVIGHKAVQTLRSLAMSPRMFLERVDRGVDQVTGGYLEMLRYPRLLRARFGAGSFRFHYLDHHLCHAASAFFVSPFEHAAILTLDGAGEATTVMTAVGMGGEIRARDRIRLPHSLGQFYSAATAFLGFDMVEGEEWKVMGLAAYGQPRYDEFLRKRVLTLGDRGFRLEPRILDHHLAKRGRFSRELVRELGPPRKPGEEVDERHMDIAASVQRVLEDVVLHLINQLHRASGETNLCLAGGVAFNSVMNGRIVDESPFDRVFIQPAAGDAGCSLGAAYVVHHRLFGNRRRYQMEDTYLGPSYDSRACAAVLRDAGVAFETLPDDVLLPRVARLIAGGAIVGWFQGRAEFGPRALGNRSFLADPRRSDMRSLLNDRVKLREWFRPLAPSVLEERAREFLERPHHDPFMTTVANVAPNKRAEIPAVVHVDGSARAHTVSRRTNPRFWQLISEFEALTGVPLLLNTSFNVREPIVLTPQDAVRTFHKASFDAMVLEDHLVLRSRS